jgi:hypothetical protein
MWCLASPGLVVVAMMMVMGRDERERDSLIYTAQAGERWDEMSVGDAETEAEAEVGWR